MKTICVTLACALALSPALQAAIVWENGAPGITTVSFNKDPFTDETDPANWDVISPSVAITRIGSNNAAFLYNPLVEAGPVGGAPAGTRWAFANFNGNPSSLSAAGFPALNFSDFRASFGGSNPAGMVGLDGVLHLVAEDIYLDIRFSFWGRGMNNDGGAFSYDRASGPIPEPSAAALLGLASLALLARRR
ncbi:MAG: PEP-CTERM sorting domain-containing protein [Akkermansiaceae bacterium]|nr:PEP-CTERM sorting domain-containing protein [Akkermansiaceae bacterium]